MSLLRTTRTQHRAAAPPHAEPAPMRSGPRGLGVPLAQTPEPAPEPAQDDPAQLAADAAAAGSWSFTVRAREAMAALGLSVAAVVEVVERPATVRPSRRAGGQVATRGGIMVVHDRAGRCVLSVMREHGSGA